jgi:hypothetical protein
MGDLLRWKIGMGDLPIEKIQRFFSRGLIVMGDLSRRKRIQRISQVV